MAQNLDPNGVEQEHAKCTWFDHMTGYLKWKIIGPDIHNPYKTPLPFHTLHRMAHQRDFLNQFVQVRCMCDGYEVMIIMNPNQPRIISSHPCISQMDRGDIVDYIRRAGLDDFIDTEIDRIQAEIIEYLHMREKDMDSEQSDLLGQKKPNKSSAGPSGKKKDDSKSVNYRIVKR